MPTFEVITVSEYREAIDKLAKAHEKLDAIDNALRLLVSEIPSLALVRDKDLVAQVEFLCGSFLLSYRLMPKQKLEISHGDAQKLVANLVDPDATEETKQKLADILDTSPDSPDKVDLGFAGE